MNYHHIHTSLPAGCHYELIDTYIKQVLHHQCSGKERFVYNTNTHTHTHINTYTTHPHTMCMWVVCMCVCVCVCVSVYTSQRSIKWALDMACNSSTASSSSLSSSSSTSSQPHHPHAPLMPLMMTLVVNELMQKLSMSPGKISGRKQGIVSIMTGSRAAGRCHRSAMLRMCVPNHLLILIWCGPMANHDMGTISPLINTQWRSLT